MRGCLVKPSLCLYMPSAFALCSRWLWCKIELPVTMRYTRYTLQSGWLSFPTVRHEGGVSRVESRHQLVGKRYNSIRSQNGQDPFCCHEVLHWIQSSWCVSKRQMDTLIRLTYSNQVQVNKCTSIIRQSTSFVGEKTLLNQKTTHPYLSKQ